MRPTHRNSPDDLRVAVIEAVAAVRGVDPTELDHPLYEAIDPDALEALFAECDAGRGAVSFQYGECAVTVHADGGVVAEPLLDE